MKQKNVSTNRVNSSFCIAFIMIVFAVFVSSATSYETKTFTPSHDWLGSGPIFSFGSQYIGYHPLYNYLAPYYGAVPVASNTEWGYAPLYYYPYNVYRTKYHYYPWFVGDHRDLPKALDIARTHSSVKIYWNGGWRSP